MKRRPKKLEHGFTLIELLIVVAIIAMISAIAVPKLLKAVNLSRDKKVISEMRHIAVAIGIYSIEYEIVPQTMDIQVLIDDLQGSRGHEQLPINTTDAWGHSFTYYYASESEYTLKSFGKDGSMGNPATTEYFDPDADIILITGVFKASHQGATAVVGH